MITSKRILSDTQSLCPHCLQVLPAQYVTKKNAVYLERTCPQHGLFSECIWKGEPSLARWHRPKKAATTLLRQTQSEKGCPFDCGRCPNHKQHSCTVLFEITHHCNLQCPVCFAAAEKNTTRPTFPPLEELVAQLHWIREQAGSVVLQLSGGEPTLYPHLPALVREAKQLFPAVQLNTNGITLAKNAALAEQLADAGLSWVFLQFDGTVDIIYTALRGKPLFQQKIQTIEQCQKVGLSVVLVPTVVAGINDHDLGNILQLALQYTPTVRGIHLQPMTTSGRNAFSVNRTRLTLPEVLTKLCEQSDGRIQIDHATPPGCEHERCSFHCRYRISNTGDLVPLRQEACCSLTDDAPQQIFSPLHVSSATGSSIATTECCAPAHSSETTEREGVDRAIETILRSWQSSESSAEKEKNTPEPDAFEAFIAKAKTHVFSVTCMAFQDVWTVDLQRLQGCCVHVFAAPDRLIPFCAYNLTAADGSPLHRQHG